MTLQQLITYALLDIDAVAQGETPNSDELQQGFDTANQILSSWSLEGATAYNQQRSTFTITPGVANYTLGPGGIWNTAARPVKITGAISKSGTFQQGMKVLPFARFAEAIANPTGRTDTLPSILGYDNAAPNLNIEIFPPPNNVVSIEVQTWQPFTAFAALSDTLNFPVPGFEAALRAELAVTLAPSYGKEASQTLVGNAQRFKQRIMAANAGMDGTIPAAPAAPQAVNPNA